MQKQEPKRSLRSVAYVIIAGLRMQKRQQAWAVNAELHEKLLGKLEGMKKQKGKTVAR